MRIEPVFIRYTDSGCVTLSPWHPRSRQMSSMHPPICGNQARRMSLAPMTMLAGPVLAMGAIPDGGATWLQFIPFILVLAIFYFIILMPMQRKQKKVAEFQQALKSGDRVITTGGIYGQITKVSDEAIQIQIADKVRIDVARAAIGGYQGQAPVVEPANQ